ncbi:hypothetical protein ASE21_11845 [Flavobacterium sp. Root901]|uniref:hypothetical protein n=1 Tax=Flavobacterium sp. Root901 TaxID=1736605 RepID=UPI00070E043B|nr:hypothetical protein [Flavobacterium sp. Root901]KRD10391.1 hypothetical protein ASE21_11845 [Flavobacterium sp. Root901]
MNTYNENLHSSVLASLESQQLSKKQLDAQLSASMFTLYYAEGAEIIASEKLDAASKMYQSKQHINNVVVKNKNMSDNLLLSANQQKTFVGQSVTNMAVCAANIQIAANAIVRLASDVGSIFSIVNAADYGSQIYQQGLDAYNLMNKTAYHAELTSQHAMEASAAVAEVPSTTVADGAKVTNDSVNNLLQVTTADLNAITAILTADNDTKSQASIATRGAEGAIKCSKVEYEASKKAYIINNKKFNQNIKVDVPKPFDPSSKGSFTVSFDYFKSPFPNTDLSADNVKTEVKNPVKSYNIIIVKESKKALFTTSTAEDLLSSPSQFVRVAEKPDEKEGKAVISLNNLLDSDNEALALGEKYVAFLLIVFTEDYKKEINTFDEYLSVASESFRLTQTLNEAKNIISSKTGSQEEESDDNYRKAPLTEFSFTVKKDDNIKPSAIDYRFILLPYPDDLLTDVELNTIEERIEVLELKEELTIYDDEISYLNEEITNLNTEIAQLNNESSKTKNPAEADTAKQKLASFKTALTEAKARVAIAKEQQVKVKAELKKVEESFPKPIKNNKAFFFNLNLAENIPAGNYISASHSKKSEKVETNLKYDIKIEPTTTDNFGNPLVEKKKYIPVVLSFFNGNEISKSKYTNSLSDWENTDPVTFSSTELNLKN